MRRKRAKDGLRQTEEHCQHDDYTPDEIEFMMHMQKYKTENNQRFPTWCEVLQVLLSLGYKKEKPS